MKKNKTNYWKPIDFLIDLFSEYVNNFIRLYRLRFRNWRLKMKIREAKELTMHDRAKRWIIYGHNYKMYIITRKGIKNNVKMGILKKDTTFFELDHSALRIITYQNNTAHVHFNKSEIQSNNQTKQ